MVIVYGVVWPTLNAENPVPMASNYATHYLELHAHHVLTFCIGVLVGECADPYLDFLVPDLLFFALALLPGDIHDVLQVCLLLVHLLHVARVHFLVPHTLAQRRDLLVHRP